MRVLIIKLSSIGDVVHTMPSLHALKALYPDAAIDWLVEEESHALLIGHPLIHELRVFKRKRWFKSLWSGNGIKEIFIFSKNLRDQKYDLVIDFQGLFKSGIMAFLSGGKIRLGYGQTRELSYLFLNDRLPPYDPDRHAVDRYLDIVRSLGWKGNDKKNYIPITSADKRHVDTLLEKHGVKESERIVLVSPKARWQTKLWSEDKFATLCDRLIEELEREVIIVGGKSDKDYIGRIFSIMKNRAIDISGQTNLRELAYLMSIAPLMICLDSGPMHIAAAVGTKTIALFGPTSPERTGPYGKNHDVIRKNLQCSPCFSKTCDDTRCMNDIGVEEVLAVIENIEHRRLKGRFVGKY
ncbi:MAG: lipopolysaccharide heptosyltransferase II [Thermodesulfobacteriota bacterium]